MSHPPPGLAVVSMNPRGDFGEIRSTPAKGGIESLPARSGDEDCRPVRVRQFEGMSQIEPI